MREAIYVILALAGAAPASATEWHKQRPSESDRYGTPARLDLRLPVLDAPSSTEFRHSAFADRSSLPGVPERPGAIASPGAARGALALALPAGWDLVAAAAMASSALVGQAAWPAGGSVPSLRATAAVSTTVKNPNLPVLDVNLSVSRNWQLDAPIGGTYLDCAVRLSVSTGALPSVALQAPCGRYGHFGASLHRSF